MTRHNKLPLQILQERVDRLREELATIDKTIDQVKLNRDKALTACQRKITSAKKTSATAKKLQEQLLSDAEATRVRGEALISSGKKLVREADQKKIEAEAMDLQLKPIRDAELARTAVQREWSEKLSQVQSGKVRRKRSQLERDIQKLEERLERRQDEEKKEAPTGPVPVVPKNFGTPKEEEKVEEAKA